MRNSLVRVLGVVSAVSLLLSACSSGAAPTASPTAAPSPTSPSATATAVPVLPSPTPFPTVMPSPTAAPSPTTAPTPTAPPLTLSTYENTIYGFSVSYPSSWEVLEDNLGQGYVFESGTVAADLQLIVDVVYDDSLKSISERATAVFASFRRSVTSAKVVTEGEMTTADGRAAYQYTLEWSGGSDPYKGIMLLAARGSTLVQLLAVGKKPAFDPRAADFAAMAKSLRIMAPKPFGMDNKQALVVRDTSPSTFDPAHIGDAISAAYAAQVFGGLVRLDKDLNIVPDLAKNWEVSDGGTTYTFHMRENAKFHSGKAVTARDVQYSLERAGNRATRSETTGLYLDDIVGISERLAGQATSISGVTVVDEMTLRIKIKQPVAYFLAKLTHPVAYVLNQSNVQSGGAGWFLAPDGTGPFKIKGWEPGVVIVLERNEAYHLTPAKVPAVIVWNRGGDALTMYKAGDVDLTSIAGGAVVRAQDVVQGVANQIVVTPQYSIYFMGFNAKVAPFNDARARRAFALALNIEALNKEFFAETVDRASGFLPNGMPGYSSALAALPFDAKQAKTLWDQVKVEKGLGDVRVNVLVNGNSVPPLFAQMAEMWRANLGANIGFVQQTDSIADELTGGAHLYEYGWVADYPDPQNFLDVLFKSGSPSNFGAYSSAAVDKVLDEAKVDSNPATRMPRYAEANRLLLQDVAAIPLNYGRDYTLVKPYVKEWSISRQGIPDYTSVVLERPVVINSRPGRDGAAST